MYTQCLWRSIHKSPPETFVTYSIVVVKKGWCVGYVTEYLFEYSRVTWLDLSQFHHLFLKFSSCHLQIWFHRFQCHLKLWMWFLGLQQWQLSSSSFLVCTQRKYLYITYIASPDKFLFCCWNCQRLQVPIILAGLQKGSWLPHTWVCLCRGSRAAEQRCRVEKLQL